VFRACTFLGLLFFLLAVMTGCMGVPRSRGELIDGAKAGKLGVGYEDVTVARPFETIADLVERKTNECLNVHTESGETGVRNYLIVNDYVPEFSRLSADTAQFTLRWYSNGNLMPDGGSYLMAVDLQRAASGSTIARWAYPTMTLGDMTDAMRAWIHGEDTPCPYE
jgi:hypothetical protein